MLDQNTDRMWYVIGAVIIGSALIFIMNGAFPQLFASVGGTFEDKTKETTEIVDGIRPNGSFFPLELDDLSLYQSTLVNYDEDTNELTLDIKPRKEGDKYWIYSRGLTVKKGRVKVEYGERMTLSYTIYIPEGITDAYVRTEVNNLLVNPDDPDWSLNDHDVVADRIMSVNGVHYKDDKAVLLKDGEWNRVTYSYLNNSPQNVNQGALYDTTRFGVRNHRYEDMRVQIRDIEWAVSKD